MTMKKPPRHPGRYIKDACLNPLALSVTEGAKVLGVARHTLSSVLNGQEGILPEMAIRLEKAGWSNAGQLLRVQAAYDLAQGTANASRGAVEPCLATMASTAVASFPLRRSRMAPRVTFKCAIRVRLPRCPIRLKRCHASAPPAYGLCDQSVSQSLPAGERTVIYSTPRSTCRRSMDPHYWGASRRTRRERVGAVLGDNGVQ